MKKIAALLTIFILLGALCGCEDESLPPRPVTETEMETETAESRIERHLAALTGQEMNGRRAGSRGEAKAAYYLASSLRQAGIKPAGDADTYMQSFDIGRYEPVLIDNRMVFRTAAGTGTDVSENVLGLLPGVEDKVIIVSAHYDHLGDINGKLYCGANDNASGAALVLELAAELGHEKPRYGILFAFWGAEEMGLLGSAYFNAHPAIRLDQVLCVLNLDSVGNLGRDKKLLGWKTDLNETSQDIVEVLSGEGWQIDWQNAGQHNSDHASFADSGISALTLLSPSWLDSNHTPRDTADKIKTKPLTDLLAVLKKALAAS